MSAIAGVFRLDGLPADQADIVAITHAMSSAGPDGMGYWRGGPVALGHCMLRATPEAEFEQQPLASENGNLVLVFDGRIDNREELQTEFARLRLHLRSESDAELVLRAFETWGKDTPDRLLGDFAFAVWDVVRQELFCAVDPTQAAQLYYARTENFIAFASFDEALLCLPGVSAEPNEELIAHVLVPSFRTFDPTRSWLRQVNSLRGGHSLIASSNGAFRVDAYWRFEAGEESSFASEAEAQAEFLSIFAEAVRCRLRAVGPVGQMLSGGLDSASIWAMARRLGAHNSPDGYHTYSAIADEPSTCKESQSILSLTKGAAAHFLAVPSFTGMVDSADLVREAWSRAHPTDNSIMLPALMCLAASRRGTRVMLHGASGDVVTAVPQKYIAQMMHSGSWRQAWAECEQASKNNNYLQGTRPLTLFLSNFWSAYAPRELRALIYRGTRAQRSTDIAAINTEFARTLRLPERLRTQRVEAAIARRRSSNQREDQAAMLSGRFGIGLGQAGYSRLGRRYGMEVRDPWGDRRVAEFFLRLPLRFKIKNGWTKHLVRQAFSPDLPKEVAWRVGKEHLGYLFTWRLMDESRDMVKNMLEEGFSDSAAYVNMEELRRRAGRLLEGGQTEEQAAADREFVHDLAVLNLMIERFLGHSVK